MRNLPLDAEAFKAQVLAAVEVVEDVDYQTKAQKISQAGQPVVEDPAVDPRWGRRDPQARHHRGQGPRRPAAGRRPGCDSFVRGSGRDRVVRRLRRRRVPSGRHRRHGRSTFRQSAEGDREERCLTGSQLAGMVPTRPPPGWCGVRFPARLLCEPPPVNTRRS